MCGIVARNITSDLNTDSGSPSNVTPSWTAGKSLCAQFKHIGSVGCESISLHLLLQLSSRRPPALQLMLNREP